MVPDFCRLSRYCSVKLDVPVTRFEAVRLYHTAGDLSRARAALQTLFDARGFNEADLYGTEQIRNGFSPALIAAGVLFASGYRERAVKMLDGLDALLDRLEANGWASYGVDSLRAESLALRGNGDSAMHSLRRAVDRGWRGAWRAREDPYLATLRDRPDFQELLKDVEARNASMRARYLDVIAAGHPLP